MKIYKIDELTRILENKQELYNGMTLDEIADKFENFKGSDRSLLRSVVKLFQKIDYTEDYLDVLNTLLDDKRVRTIMRKGFGGTFSDTKIRVSKKTTKRTDFVIPTQNEIDMNKSLKWGLINFKGTVDKQIHRVPSMLKGIPIVTFNGKYIIDGHHRWSQIYCFNKVRDGKPTEFAAINFVNDEMSPLDMLKVVQTTIGLDLHPKKIEPHIADENPKNNLLSDACTEDVVMKMIEDNITDDTIKYMIEFHEGDGVKDKNSVADFIISNCMDMKKYNNCIKDAPNRGAMPQTDDDDKLLGNLKNTTDLS